MRAWLCEANLQALRKNGRGLFQSSTRETEEHHTISLSQIYLCLVTSRVPLDHKPHALYLKVVCRLRSDGGGYDSQMMKLGH
jgi:hypothetical protein